MGKNVLIIGASGDIGSQIALQLGNEGYSLILHYNQNNTMMESLQNNLPIDGILDIIQADLTKKEGIDHVLSRLVYPVDRIVFASGIAYYSLFQDTPEYIMDEMLSIHVRAPLSIIQSCLPSMIRRKTGKIVIISSIWGEVGASNEVLYSTVKGAQNAFVKALAKEVGPSGITVNAISPGFIETKMNPFDTEDKNMLISEIPLNRSGTPQDVANTVSFLLSEKAGYIHGEIIRVNGGWTG